MEANNEKVKAVLSLTTFFLVGSGALLLFFWLPSINAPKHLWQGREFELFKYVLNKVIIASTVTAIAVVLLNTAVLKFKPKTNVFVTVIELAPLFLLIGYCAHELILKFKI